MPKNKPSEETLAQARRVIDALNERGAHKQAIRLKVTRPDAPLPQTASKFGGRPYLPAGESAPTNEKGEPLGMIAQINCADLPENDIYPATGMLQFWINPNDEECMWGYDYENPLSQKNHRVVYYEKLGEPNPDAPFPTVNWDDYGWPWQEDEEYALQFTAADSIPWWLYAEEDEQRFIDAWNAAYPQQTIAEFYDLDGLGEGDIADDILDDIEENNEELHRIGGVPIFTQNDPRDENKALRGYSINLLTIVSDFSEEEEGDAGTANWLITPEQLAARDFSKVLFEWACG